MRGLTQWHMGDGQGNMSQLRELWSRLPCHRWNAMVGPSAAPVLQKVEAMLLGGPAATVELPTVEAVQEVTASAPAMVLADRSRSAERRSAWAAVDRRASLRSPSGALRGLLSLQMALRRSRRMPASRLAGLVGAFCFLRTAEPGRPALPWWPSAFLCELQRASPGDWAACAEAAWGASPLRAFAAPKGC